MVYLELLQENLPAPCVPPMKDRCTHRFGLSAAGFGVWEIAPTGRTICPTLG